MKLEEYRNIYDTMTLTPEADTRILQGVQSAQKKKQRTIIRFVSTAAAVAVLMLAVLQIPPVSAVAREAIQQFAVWIHVADDEDVRYEEAYLTVRAGASQKASRMSSLTEVEKELGISLLQSADAYEVNNCISYQPYVSDSGNLNGVVLLDLFYATGDLQDVEIATTKDLTVNNTITYRPGTDYGSPILMQIIVRTDQADGVDYDNHELDYTGTQEDWSDSDAVLYELKHLDVKAVLTTVQTDGPSTWQNRDGNTAMAMTSALLVYKGVEYRYLGAVAPAIMQNFLDSLTEVG